MNDLTEKKASSTEVFSGKLLKVFKDDIILPNGKEAIREYIKHPGASCVVPVTDNNEVLMVRQFRYPFDRVLLEIPAGKLDFAGEDPKSAAIRELKEETGAETKDLIFMGEYYPTCAYSTEIIYMYLARDLSFGETDFDDDEFIEPERISLKALFDMVMNGEIRDGKTQTAILKAYNIVYGNK
ncbi:MAG: NUDIX hydrolase [Oscillospiraceae bacterium]|nr:NUDIX hydrolase [Oscillospiraceae bacterium]